MGAILKTPTSLVAGGGGPLLPRAAIRLATQDSASRLRSVVSGIETRVSLSLMGPSRKCPALDPQAFAHVRCRVEGNLIVID